MKQEIKTYAERPKSYAENLNETQIIYICYDKVTDKVKKVSSKLFDVWLFCKYNNCNYSTYPIGTYTEN